MQNIYSDIEELCLESECTKVSSTISGWVFFFGSNLNGQLLANFYFDDSSHSKVTKENLIQSGGGKEITDLIITKLAAVFSSREEIIDFLGDLLLNGEYADCELAQPWSKK